MILWQYPLVELATGILFLIFYLKFYPDWMMIVRDWVFISFLIIIFVYDLRHMYILDRFTIPAMIVALILNLWMAPAFIPFMILGAIIMGSFFYLQFVISKGTWVGGGDIRMGVLMGLMLGLNQGLVALFVAYLLGSIVGVILLASKRVSRKTPIAFGTFLAAATVLLLFFGNAPLNWYLSLLI